jgi:hypothetical protein
MFEMVKDFANLPNVKWLGVTILEPSTVITNLLIAAACFYAYLNLKKKRLPETKTQLYITYFFLLMGFATVIGGVIGHAFLYTTGLYGKIPGWYISMAGVALFERAAIGHGRPFMSKKLGDFFSTLNYLEIITFMALSLIKLNFIFVMLHAFYGLFIVVFCFETFVYLKAKDPSFKYLLLATIFGLLAILCHVFQVGINKWFNYNDVSHLEMTVAIIFYYKAALHIRIHEEGEKNTMQVNSKN